MPTLESHDTFVVVEVHDEDNVLVESINALVGMVLEVPVQDRSPVIEVEPPPGVEVATVLEPEREVLEVYDGPMLVEATVQGPQGPPGDTRVHIGPTPPQDTSMVWVDTS